MTTDVETYIARLQAEAGKTQFHKKLKAWVSDDSSAVRLLRDFAEQQEGASNG